MNHQYVLVFFIVLSGYIRQFIYAICILYALISYDDMSA
jgi:hypothetical protein